jgi:hypothetical protein
VAAGAAGHGRDEVEAGRKGEALTVAKDGDVALVDDAAKRLQDIAPDLGQVVEEEDAAVGEARLARPRSRAAADRALPLAASTADPTTDSTDVKVSAADRKAAGISRR